MTRIEQAALTLYQFMNTHIAPIDAPDHHRGTEWAMDITVNDDFAPELILSMTELQDALVEAGHITLP